MNPTGRLIGLLGTVFVLADVGLEKDTPHHRHYAKKAARLLMAP